MPGISDDHAVVIAPFRDDCITRARNGAAQDVEARTEVANARRREGTNAARHVVGGCRHDAASPRMSFSTPAAVTAGPAPGPVMINGFV